MMNRRDFLAASSALAATVSFPKALYAASGNPDRRLICGATPGAIGDHLAKGAVALLPEHDHAAYRIETTDRDSNREAIRRAKASAADGTVMLQSQSGPMVLYPSLYQRLDYSPLNDFKPVVLLGEYSYGFFVGPAVPGTVTTINGYLDWVRENPDYRDVAYAHNGSQAHLLTLMLGRIRETAIRPQGYSSALAIMNDLGNKTIAAGVAILGNLAQAKAEGIRAIAVTDEERHPALPTVATFSEQGILDLNLKGWFGWFVPAATADAIVQEISDQAKAMEIRSEYASLQRELLLTAATDSPAEIHNRMVRETADFARLVKSYGISYLG